MPSMQRFAVMAGLLTFIALSTPGTAGAVGFKQFIVFGDSTLDTGYFHYHKSGNDEFDAALDIAIDLGATGGWAGNGVMNTTILAEKFGLNARSIDDGGTNYANGGATTMNNNGAAVPDNIYTIQQIENYLSAVHSVANPNALYLIKSGDNDATYVTSQSQAWRDASPNYLNDVASSLATEVAKLQAAGARHIVVRNSYDSALFAEKGGDIPFDNAAAYARSRALGNQEWSDMAALGVHFIPADNDSLFKFIAHNPTLFGFTPDTVLSTEAPFYTDPRQYTAIMCILTPEEQRDYLFIDGIHLTTAGQRIEADYTYNLLIAPSQISLMAESVVQGGWARASTIQAQLDPCGQLRGPCGTNVWASTGAYGSQIRNAPGFTDDSGAPYGGTVGVDHQIADGIIMGAAFSGGGQTQAFSTGGSFNEVDEAASLYFAYVGGPLWGNVVATYDVFQDRISRPVPLGIYTDENNGKTTGQSVAIALRGGWSLGLDRFTFSPVAGLILQQAQVDAFTENGDSGITALSFGNQTRDSLVTQLGWRVCADVGSLRPFMEMNWNHECAGRFRTVTTSLTTVGAPSYVMDAVPVASDWATSSLGAYYELSPQVMLRGAASAMFINPRMTTCGGEFSLNIAY